MEPAALRFIVKSTVLNYLVCSSDISRDHIVMLEYFKCFGQGVFGDEILSQIIRDFPGELTDELLIALSSPHLRHLKLTNCSRLSCNGLQKTIAKCQQLQALDFSECIHLLHPTVFCCIKDKASNLVSLSLENSQVVSDDIVQVALMCCPGLKHLNLSGCRNITDAAFAFPNTDKSQSSTASAYSTSSTHLSQPGHNLTNVDISGCQCLSTVTVKYLVRLCGAHLKGINLAWTGVNCTALLYLAGLNMDHVARLVQEADPAVKQHPPYESSADGQTVDEQTFVACDKENVELPFPVMDANLEMSQCEMQDLNIDLQPCVSSTSFVGVEVALDPCNSCENQDVNSLRSESVRTKNLQDFTESSDEESDDSFKTATDEIEPCFLSEEETGFAATCTCTELKNSRTDESLECKARYGNDLQSHSGLCGVREFCSNATTENDSTIGKLEVNQNSNEDVCVLPENRSKTFMELQKMLGSEHHIDRNPGMFSSFSKQGEGDTVGEEIFEDCFDAEKDPAVCTEQGNITGGQFRVTQQCVFKTHTSLNKDCHGEQSTGVANMAVNGMKPVKPTMSYNRLKDGDFSNCGNMPLARMDHEETEYSEITCDSVKYGLHKVTSDYLPCNKSLDSENLSCEDSTTQYACTSHHEEPVCPVHMDAKVSENEGCYSAFGPHNPLVETTLPDVQKNNVKGCELDAGVTSCHGIEVTLSSGPHEEELNDQSKHSGRFSDTETTGTSDCLSPCSKVTKFSDKAQAQIYYPQITSLDITNICYQSKPIGELCLKVFSDTCKCLKSFAVSWTQLDDEVLIYLLKNEPELESLSLVDCENLGDISISSIPVYCPKLTSFDLKGLCYVTDHGVMPLTRSNELQSLCLAEAAITDSTLESISKGCAAKLKYLDVSWCEDISDRGMTTIANSCSSLQHLSLRQCAASHLTLNTLAANCHLISMLNIAGVSSLTDTTLSNLAKNMPLLREIDASWNSSLSDIGVSALLEFCTQLNKAVLCGLKRITSQPFLAIIGDLGRWCLLEELWRYSRGSQGGAPKGKVALKTCNSEKAKSIGDQIPWRSMSYAPSLRQIVLEYSDKVNDDHLAAVVAVCRGTLFVKDYYGQTVEPKWIFR